MHIIVRFLKSKEKRKTLKADRYTVHHIQKNNDMTTADQNQWSQGNNGISPSFLPP